MTGNSPAAGEDKTFLGGKQTELTDADTILLPLPSDLTSTFKHGTLKGPQAVIDVSAHMETWDAEWELEPLKVLRLHTHRSIAPQKQEGIDTYLSRVTRVLECEMPAGAFVLGLGGEHSISSPLAQTALRERHGTVVQIDAHADLRDSYVGQRNNHGCPMRRIVEGGHSLIAIGIGMLAPEERDYVRANPEQIDMRMSWELVSEDSFAALLKKLAAELSGDVYLTIDLDGMDSGAAPGTGTPVPGGLSYHRVTDVIRALFRNTGVLVRGADIVEILPLSESRISEFTSAMLVFRILSELAAQKRAGKD